eukprot:5629822-Prymnesium_polylepis.1
MAGDGGHATAHCVLDAALAAADGATSSSELQLAGRRCRPSAVPPELARAIEGERADGGAVQLEEVLASHGVLDETIAGHHAPRDQADARAQAVCRREERLAVRLGLPPRTPALATAHAVIAELASRCWRALLPRLSL